MCKRIICIYRVEYNDTEIGYMRVECNDSLKCFKRTAFNGQYSSYMYAVCGISDCSNKIFDDFDTILVDAYEEYYT